MELVSLRKMSKEFRKKKIAKLKIWRRNERNAYQEQAQYDIHYTKMISNSNISLE